MVQDRRPRTLRIGFRQISTLIWSCCLLWQAGLASRDLGRARPKKVFVLTRAKADTQHQQTKSVTSLDLDAPDSQVTQVSQGSLIAPAGATRGSYPVSVPHPEHLLMLAQAGPTCSLGLSMKEAGELVNWWIGARVRKETEGSLAIGLVRGWLATG